MTLLIIFLRKITIALCMSRNVDWSPMRKDAIMSGFRDITLISSKKLRAAPFALNICRPTFANARKAWRIQYTIVAQPRTFMHSQKSFAHSRTQNLSLLYQALLPLETPPLCLRRLLHLWLSWSFVGAFHYSDGNLVWLRTPDIHKVDNECWHSENINARFQTKCPCRPPMPHKDMSQAMRFYLPTQYLARSASPKQINYERNMHKNLAS